MIIGEVSVSYALCTRRGYIKVHHKIHVNRIQICTYLMEEGTAHVNAALRRK
jgi:hypothetical protein